jgi:hypothetical protein
MVTPAGLGRDRALVPVARQVAKPVTPVEAGHSGAVPQL